MMSLHNGEGTMYRRENDVVVTGLAAVSAAGIGANSLREVLRRGEPVLQPIP